jgi:predicted nucleic acid-binding protein
MTACFADTSYYLALINSDDVAFASAADFTQSFDGEIITTSAVINELGNHLASRHNRALFSAFFNDLRKDPDVSIIHVDGALFEAGFDLYSARIDKDWSLTDCISFVLMRDRQIRDALTTDHHFEQAGFQILLRP